MNLHISEHIHLQLQKHGQFVAKMYAVMYKQIPD